MSTKKKTVSQKSSTPVKKSAPATKTVVKSQDVKKILPKSVVKTAPKKATPVASKKALPVSSKKAAPQHKKAAPKHHEDHLAKEALKLVNEATTHLRTGIKTTAKARIAAHKKAHSLLGKATSFLDDLLKEGSSLMHKAINKL
ncbi:MAG TPA: hypothetical protein VJK54_04115 [Chthoniobacterales bacterium]|nr:hypothetical protein [Chthoniobacterales bacterium]